MSFFDRLWSWIVDILSDIWDKEGPALSAWLHQFRDEVGELALQLASEYGPKIFSGEISIVDAKDAVFEALKAKGIEESDELLETVFNALRTQTNLAATKVE